MTDANWEEYIERYEVDVIPADKLMYIYRYPVRFVKIDVENYEYEVIKGLKNTIEKYEPILLLEFNNREQQESIISFVNCIKPYQLKWYDYIKGKFEDVNYCCSTNYFLIPRDRILEGI